MESISCHIKPLVISSFGGRLTHTQTHIPTIHTGSILRIQVCTWFNKLRINCKCQKIGLYACPSINCYNMKTERATENYNYIITQHQICIKMVPLVKLAIISKTDEKASSSRKLACLFSSSLQSSRKTDIYRVY